jgi:hypothetical protein
MTLGMSESAYIRKLDLLNTTITILSHPQAKLNGGQGKDAFDRDVDANSLDIGVTIF